jgi:hypothetical protein
MRNVYGRVAGAVMRAMAQAAGVEGPALILDDAIVTPWASVTFAGARHVLAVTLHGADEVAVRAALDQLLLRLPEMEIALVGEIVADLTVELEALGEGEAGCFAVLKVEVLTVGD